MHPELVAARRAIALGRLTAFESECRRLDGLVHSRVVSKADAVDTLLDADVANDLSATYGADLVQWIMANAFSAGAELPALEVAA